jgi:hypothetical protein
MPIAGRKPRLDASMACQHSRKDGWALRPSDPQADEKDGDADERGDNEYRALPQGAILRGTLADRVDLTR